ncbi:MAG: hypothetical protein GY801_25155 [bacterium]|nr:hypothetical protein [bacterium]
MFGKQPGCLPELFILNPPAGGKTREMKSARIWPDTIDTPHENLDPERCQEIFSIQQIFTFGF